ncbi:MAG: AsmA-like C-terminal region-containing protein [Isosphaeraceae bacterium]
MPCARLSLSVLAMTALEVSRDPRDLGGIPMRHRRFCWLGLMIPLGVLLAPPFLWVLIVLIAPTNWARSHVIAKLERSSGRSVQLDDLDVCLDGGIELTGLKIGAPRSVGDPWLEAKRIQIDVSLWQLLWGKFEPTNLQADEATLRVLRRKDGSFELADLVRFDGDSTATSSAEPHRCGPSKLKTKVRQTRILLIDQPSQTQLTFDEVEGEGIWEREGAFVATLSGRLNQGPFEFTAHLDRSGGQPNFEGQFRTSDVVLDQGMSMLRYLVPVLAGTRGQLQGRMAMDVYLRGRGGCRKVLGKSLVGNGSLVLDPIELNGTPLMTEFAKLAELSSTDNLASIRSDFVVQDGRIKTDHLTLTAGRIPVAISGWTDFDGRLDYQVKLDGVADRIPDQARKFISGLDLDLNSLTSLRLRGNVDRVVITAGTAAEGRSPLEQIIGPEDRERFKVLGRQFRDKLMR